MEIDFSNFLGQIENRMIDLQLCFPMWGSYLLLKLSLYIIIVELGVCVSGVGL